MNKSNVSRLLSDEQIRYYRALFNDINQTLRSEWAAVTHEPFPDSIEKWQEWCTQADMPFVQNFEGKFKVRQVWPMIIGELKRRHRQPSSDRVNNANGKSHSNVRGAPRVTDPKRDGMIDASVKDSHSRAAVARMYGIDIDEVKRAQDRNRKRNK